MVWAEGEEEVRGKEKSNNKIREMRNKWRAGKEGRWGEGDREEER